MKMILALILSLVCNTAMAEDYVLGVGFGPKVLISAKGKLKLEEREKIAGAFEKAARLAVGFAEKNGIKIHRPTLPCLVILRDGPDGVAKETGLPSNDCLGVVVARIDLTSGAMYLSRVSESDVLVELGKWLFYEQGYQWGQNKKADKRHLELAEKFAKFCRKGK